jgi:hypothetical protein
MSNAMARRLRTSDVVGSTLGFGAVLTALVVMDPRVSHKFSSAFYPSPSEKLLSWGDRIADLLGTVLVAMRQQSLENGPLLVMTVIGILLVGFMVRT